MFRPMAITVILALLAALVLSVTFVPAAIAILLARARSQERESRVDAGGAVGVRARARRRAAAAAVLVIGVAALLLAVSLALASRMGSEFIPSLDEGDVALHALRIPGTSLTQAVSMQAALERALRSRARGRDDLREDRHGRGRDGSDAAERRRRLRDDEAARRVARSAQVEGRRRARRSSDAVARVPGNNYEFTQPIQMRFNELIAGVRSDVAVKVFGDDLALLLAAGESHRARCSRAFPAPPT